ncbi:hypothetical protein [Cryobacterium tepidiphilum]|uniref:hypothetical protein n=1 Tax=Cryobacterium tepidiphilum TaxID=2486026 RepID=UPI0011CECD31|nr:hypothetical protein [Cryobacterium tepidiphilum]
MPRPPKPGGAVFVPRSYASNRKKFGNSSTRLGAEVSSPQQAAAELQHAIANKVREYVLDHHSDLKAYCDKEHLPAGLSYERLQRIMRGETMMTFTDLMYWGRRIPALGSFVGEAVTEISSEAVVEN